MFYKMYTKHIPYFPFPYSDSTEMLSYSSLLSTLPQIDLFSYTDFTLTARLLAKPRPDSGIFVASKDTSSVAIKS